MDRHADSCAPGEARIRECRGRAEVMCGGYSIQGQQRPCRFSFDRSRSTPKAIFFFFFFFHFREATALLLPKVSRRQTADRRAVWVRLCTNHPLISRPNSVSLTAAQPASQAASQAACWMSCQPTAVLQLHCTALHCTASRNCALQLLSTFSNPPFILHSRAISLSLSHTHTHTRRPLHRRIRLPCCLAACLPARTCQPAPACPYLPRSETAVQRAGPVLCLCLCLCLCRRLGRPSAAPPVFGGSPSCIAIAENILTTSTRRRLNPAQSQAPSSPSSAAHCLHSLASFLLVVGHSLLLPLGLFPSLSFCLSPCLSLSLSSCTSEPHIVGTTLVVRIVACTASHPNDNAIPRATPFLATFGESHRNHARTYTSSSTVLLPSSRAALSSASTWIPRHSRHGTTAALRSTTRAKSAQTTHQRAALAALTHVPARRSRCAQSHHSNLAAGLNRPPRHFRSAPPSVAH